MRFSPPYATFVLCAIFGTIAPAFAQSPSDAATLQSLLAEVRQLRQTVEKSLSITPRIQLTLERAQMQNQKVMRLAGQLDEVRKEIAAETSRQTSANDRLARLEQELSVETDAAQRKQMEDMRRGLKMVLGNGPDQQLRARESELSNALQTEQALLDELNGKLDSLERQLPR